MPFMLDADFFRRAEQLQMAAFKTALLDHFLATHGPMPDDAHDTASLQQTFAQLWHEATEEMALDDRMAIAKFMNIRLKQDDWSKSELHRNYVERMLSSDDHFIRIEDGIAAIHQNILEQHYAT